MIYLLSKEDKILLDFLYDSSVDMELKVFMVLELVGEGRITLRKGHELLGEIGVYSEHWVGLDARVTDMYEDRYADN